MFNLLYTRNVYGKKKEEEKKKLLPAHSAPWFSVAMIR